MLAKLQSLLASAKPLAQSAISMAPLPVGIAIGYLGHGIIKLGIDSALALAKLALHL